MDLEGLSLVCAGLGVIEENDAGNKIGYTKSPHCLENLKDLMRFLRRDDPQTREVFKQVSKWNIVGKDLIPIIEHYQDDYNLVLNAVKILVFLTIPVDPTSSDLSHQIEYLWELKSCITNSHTVPVVVSILEKPLHNLESGDFTEDDWKLLQLVLTLFRNLLAIQDITLQQKLGGSASQIMYLRDRFLKLLFDENVMDIIIVLAQHVEGSRGFLRKDNLLLLETFHYIFMGQDPEMVAGDKRCSQAGPGANTNLDSLKSIVHDEKKQSISRTRTLGRHSQFTGMFTRYTMDGSKSLRAGTPILTSHDSQLKPNKNKTVRGISKRPALDHGILPSTEHGILRSLHDFVKQFLNGGYNALMESIRLDIEKEHQAIENADIVVFFRVTEFISSFQYHKLLSTKPEEEGNIYDGSTEKDDDCTIFNGNICGPIASSMNESMFLLVISKWRQAFEGLKETNNYKFLSAAGSVMKTLIRMLDTVFKLSPDGSKEGHTARILLYKLFYDQTDQGLTQFVLCLMKSFDINKQPKSDLSDLVEIIHVIVRVLEKLQADGTLRVSKKARKGRVKKHQKSEKVDDMLNGEDDVGSDLKVLNNDPSAELKQLNKEDLNEGHKKDDESEAELSGIEKMNSESKLLHVDQKRKHINDDYLSDQSSDYSEEQKVATTEVDFKISTLVFGFANEHIIRNLCWLLSFYKNNSLKTNYYIVCMLRRICEDLELSPMLYQLSFLTTFYKILAEQKSCPCKDHENIVQFLTTLIRRMLRKMKSQPLLFVEILFWKTRRECKYISCNSMLHELSHFRDGTSNWGNGPGNGQLGQQGLRRSIADALGDDEADVVVSRDNNNVDEAGNDGKFGSVTEVGRQENLDSWDGDAHHEAGKISKRKRLVLNSEMEDKIKNLYDRYKDDPHCTEVIANALDSYGNISAAQVSYKLKQLGFTVPSKKRSRNPSSDKITDQEIGMVNDIYPSSNSNHMDESTSFRKELPTTKRVRAFSKDQEEKIKILYEQFKGQRRCSHMIASALDSNVTYTASQVSRKLKQLGLRTLKTHKSEKAHLASELHGTQGTDDDHNSDDETLLSISIRNRNKKKIKQRADDVPNMENASADLLDGSSDDQLTIRKRGKKLQKLRGGGNLTTASSHRSEIESEIDEDYQGSKMDGSEQIFDTEAVAGSISGSLDSMNSVPDSVVHKAREIITGLPNEDLLEDSEDDAAPVVLTEIDDPGHRRRKQMVMDFEDDD